MSVPTINNIPRINGVGTAYYEFKEDLLLITHYVTVIVIFMTESIKIYPTPNNGRLSLKNDSIQ